MQINILYCGIICYEGTNWYRKQKGNFGATNVRAKSNGYTITKILSFKLLLFSFLEQTALLKSLDTLTYANFQAMNIYLFENVLSHIFIVKYVKMFSKY